MTDDEARELIKGSRNGFRIGDKLERVFRLVVILPSGPYDNNQRERELEHFGLRGPSFGRAGLE